MAFSYGFFNAKNLDRVYTAEDFTGYLSSIICNGIFDTYGDCFSVTAADGLSVQIGTGKAWISGHYFTSNSAYTLDLSKYVDESLSRYVAIGIRDTVCISFCLNELLSIVENASLMGIPFPPVIKKAIDVLQTKVGRAEEQIKEEESDNGNSET